MDGRRLLISDVDGTLLGDDRALDIFHTWTQRHRDRLALVYNSGRFCESIMESVRTTRLPAPDALIGGVGTEIRLADGRVVKEWTQRFECWDAPGIRETLAGFNELELQPEVFQSDHKVSYFAYNASPELLRQIEARLEEVGLRTRIVYSSQRDLDVLPAAAGKGTASAFLAEFWEADPLNVCVSGDSGNDLAMFQHDFLGIVVANAHPELKELRGPHIFQATLACAAGVLQGLQHWFDWPEAPELA